MKRPPGAAARDQMAYTTALRDTLAVLTSTLNLDEVLDRILANVHHVVQDTWLTAEQQEFVQTIHKSSDALMSVINDVLDFSKIESGRLELDVQPFSLRACLDKALHLMAHAADERGLALAYTVADGVPDYILGDTVRVHQVLLNLLIDKSHLGGTIARSSRLEVCAKFN